MISNDALETFKNKEPQIAVVYVNVYFVFLQHLLICIIQLTDKKNSICSYFSFIPALDKDK